jgi:putative two-component system response regulator
MSRVLIVDDDAADLELLKTYLAETVDEVCCVNDSRKAEHAFVEFEPDLVVLDLRMPAPDGFEVLRRLRGARVSLGYLPVIVLSGDDSHVARNSALILGADEFVNKPVDRDELVIRVRNLLRTRRTYIAAREGRPD